MKSVILSLCALTGLCLAQSEVKELNVKNAGPSIYELVTVHNQAVAVIESVEASRSMAVIKYFLSQNECIAISISVKTMQWDNNRDDWAVDEKGNIKFSEKKMILYPHDKDKFKQAQEMLDSGITDLFEHYNKNIKPQIS